MALNEDQTGMAWTHRIDAETHALYYGNLAARYSRHKERITFGTFFLSSGAAATLIGRLPVWVPTVLSLLVALATAWSVASNLDTRIAIFAKLHESWLRLSCEYEQLWSNVHGEESPAKLYELERREHELSVMATTQAPEDKKMMAQAQKHIFQINGLHKA